MAIANNGDLSQHFRSIRQSGLTKARLSILNNELATGRRDDVAKSLGGNTSWLSSINREITLSQQYGASAAETGRRLNFTQTSLQQIDELRQGLTDSFLKLEFSGPSQAKFDASDAARTVFKDIVGAINQKFAGKSLMGGAVTDLSPLADSDVMLADIEAEISGLTTASDISTALDVWFDDPAGGFATLGYQGETGSLEQKRLTATQSIQMEARADQQGLKDVLRAAAQSAIFGDLAGVLADGEVDELVKNATSELIQSGDTLVGLRGKVGFSEARVDETITSLAAQVTSLGVVRNDSTLADPFETSTALLNAQQQLELQFTMTARLSGLSLVNYL